MKSVILEISELLKGHPVTRGLSPDDIAVIAGCAERRTLTKEQYLWRQGDRSETVYLLESGQVALEISVPGQGPLRIEILHGGDILGCSSIMDPRRCQFDARALTPLTCLALDSAKLRAAMERDSHLGYELLKRMAPLMAQHLESARLRLFEGLAHPVTARRR